MTSLTGTALAFGMHLSAYDGAQGIGAALAYRIDRTLSVNAGRGGSLLAPAPA